MCWSILLKMRILRAAQAERPPPTSESKNYVQFALVIFRIVGVSTLLDR